MKSAKCLLLFPIVIAALLLAFAGSVCAQLLAYDDAGNYLVTANWTNGANQGFGFTPWTIVTNGPDFHGTYITTANNPTFVIASLTNALGTNYTCVWGVFANGPTDINETTAYRGFASSLGTNTFKLQWGSRGAGVTTTLNSGPVHGWCGFTLRNGNATNSVLDFQTGALLYFYFLDGAAPSTLYFWDGNGVQSVPGTSFSDLGRNNITNAIEAEVTPGPDGLSYHLVLKDCVQNRTIFTTNSVFISSGTVDSAALFCYETTGDQVYNRMQIAVPRVPPTISNLQPQDGSLYVSAGPTNLSFEVDSFNSTVSSNSVSVYLNGIQQPGSSLSFNTAGPTNQLLAVCAATLAPDTFYTYTIAAQDANGNVVSNNYTFNTFLASDLYIDAYDYNYGNGQFIDAFTPSNAYAELLGNNSTDYSISDLTGTNNTAGYRPGDLPQILQLNTDATGDPIDHANLRAHGYTAYNIGFTDTGNWENYSRTFPATNYSIYARAASAGGGQFEIERLANATATTTNQPMIPLGRVNVPVTGGSKVYSGQLMPLADFFGNTVVVPLSGVNTLRETAVASRVYNLEYLVAVAVTNDTTLRPYIATGSPTPNATGVSLTTPITFAIANRQTTATTNNLQVFLNMTTNSVTITNNLTSRLVISSNTAGVTVSWSPTNNLLASASNTVTAIFTDSAGVNVTNSWNFVTGTSGGIVGTGVWSGGGGSNDMFWADAVNWTGNTPGLGSVAVFANPGATTTLVTNNIVATNVTIGQLSYSTNNSGYHTTWIQDGVTVTVTNGATANGTQAFTVGGYYAGAGLGTLNDNVFNMQVTNTITGANGTLLVLGNPQGSGLANALNFQVRQCAVPAAPEQTVLDMSGLGTFIARVGKMTVGQGGTGAAQSNCTARVSLARTNIITLLRVTSGVFVVGDSSGGPNTLPGNTLNLGLTNSLYFDSMNVGNRRATNALVRFNPIFTNANPAVYIRNTNGPASGVSAWNIGNVNGDTTATTIYNSGTVDFSGGTVDVLVGTMILGAGSTSASDTGFAQGTLTLTAGTLNVTNLQLGVQHANNTATESGIVNVNGTATLISTNVTLAQTASGANASLVTGTLNINNGTVQAKITAGGGLSTVNVNAGALIVVNNAGTVAVPLTSLNLTGASLRLKVDGNATTAPVNATAVSASGTTIKIDSVANVSGPTTIHLISYSGTDPFAGFSLAPLPSGYAGNLVDNSGNIDLNVNVSAPPPPPTIHNINVSSGQVIISGTNNVGAGGTYHLLTSTNVALPLASWTVLTNGNFDANGNFSSTNATGTSSQQFFILQVP